MANIDQIRSRLGDGLVIPATPLALTSRRQFDPRRQRALFRYYLAAGAGGLAVGVHTTQFAIRDPRIGLFKPVLEVAAQELQQHFSGSARTRFKPGEFPIGIAGICGPTRQAAREAALARELGFHAGLLSLGALAKATEARLLQHCRAVADVIPLIGFYLQPAVGGRELPYSFWRRFSEIENVVAIKIAPFNRYQTLDVIRAVIDSGREEIALYTGNDDNIVPDLLTPFRFDLPGMASSARRPARERRIVGGLLGHWAVWTKRAVEIHRRCRSAVISSAGVPEDLLRLGVEVTDCNAALFDAANGFAGCIPGIHEILRRQGLLESIACLDPKERLSPGQREEIDRVRLAYPHLQDDDFVAAHREEWLRD